ncbi:lactonase family protein [Pollutimonas sp. M17]|uniref:lactonase family protein n=1 Tax=Pollutimonas sp. M17 TaxID=2962065 RepID=UPI0021F4DDBE|nr:lactonase family protein [Pollutimonas sp. M17]UYO93140.1 lactonase family protein [Pollutimonas sp. M17]
MFAYVGSRTTRERNARGEGISVFDVQSDGRLEQIQIFSGGPANPSYLALNRLGDRLYATHGDQQEASSFMVQANGRLELLNTVRFTGKNPVHLALDAQERWLVVSVHLAGKVIVLPILADGRLGEVHASARTFGDPGPHRIEQPFAKPHFNLFDPSGRFVIVPDKGVDRVFSFRFDDGELRPAQQPYTQAREGAGPRTAVFHPVGRHAYVVNELDSTITSYAFDDASGMLTPTSIFSTLSSNFTGNNRAAGIQINRDGTRLYASNRGNDSIALFQLDASGVPHFLETIPSGGRTPRFFTLSPDEKTLYALNEGSDSIVAFSVDPDSGRLSLTNQVTSCGSPVCMVFNHSER